MASRLPGSDRLPVPTVLLMHELPDGTSHIDWMIAREPEGCEPLVTFHLDRRIDELSPGERIVAERLADHRPAYLDYEGPVSQDRGSVKRIARGKVKQIRGETILLEWDREAGQRFEQRLQLTALDAEQQWSVTCIAEPAMEQLSPATVTTEES